MTKVTTTPCSRCGLTAFGDYPSKGNTMSATITPQTIRGALRQVVHAEEDKNSEKVWVASLPERAWEIIEEAALRQAHVIEHRQRLCPRCAE